MSWWKRILFGPKPDRKNLDKLAVARPIHESFEETARRLSKHLGGEK